MTTRVKALCHSSDDAICVEWEPKGRAEGVLISASRPRYKPLNAEVYISIVFGGLHLPRNNDAHREDIVSISPSLFSLNRLRGEVPRG